MISRRQFFATTFATTLLGALARAREKGAPLRIVLRSSWQTVNIGDIAHTPGVLHLLEQYLPEVEVRLWPNSVGNGVEEMLARRFPKVKIMKGREDILAALAECDFLLHGSGPSFVAQKDVAKWKERTGKPYGIYGITFATKDPEAKALLSAASFVYFRDSVSLQYARDQGINSPIMDFCPEGSFAVDLRNDAAADAFLKEHGLEEGKFLCCIPRYRTTPYWKIKPNIPLNEKADARNMAMREHDLGPLREAIVAVVKQTSMKVLVCPEDATQMEIGKEMLVDKLPEDVKSRVAWRPNYWLTDEAVSTYVKSAGLFGAEMHSPIMCIGNGVPAIVCRWKEQTSKGLMWRDIGLGEWLFDMDNEEEVARVVPTVLALAQDPAAAKAKAIQARDLVRKLQKASMAVVGRAAQGAPVKG